MLDPAYASGTCTPEPGGLTPREVFPLVREPFAGRRTWWASSFVELNPPVDPGYHDLPAAPGFESRTSCSEKLVRTPIKSEQTVLSQADPDQTRSEGDATSGICRTLSHTERGSMPHTTGRGHAAAVYIPEDHARRHDLEWRGSLSVNLPSERCVGIAERPYRPGAVSRECWPLGRHAPCSTFSGCRRHPLSYLPRVPERSVLYEVVRDHLETFLANAAASRSDAGLPRFIEREFRDFLSCGQLAGGFARLRCTGCGTDRLLPFSCKRRTCVGAVVDAGWPSAPRTWSNMCSPTCRCGNGCCRCRIACATSSPGTMISAAR